jgi:hypothetical protein
MFMRLNQCLGLALAFLATSAAANAATIAGDLFSLQKGSLAGQAVEIRISDDDQRIFIPVNDVTDPKDKKDGLLVVTRTDGKFLIEIPDIKDQQLRKVSVRFRRQGVAIDTQVLSLIIMNTNKSYVVDVTVPEASEMEYPSPAYDYGYCCPRPRHFGFLRR